MKDTNLNKMDMGQSESSYDNTSLQLIDAIETLETLLDDDVIDTESYLTLEVQDHLQKLQDKLLSLLPSEGPSIEEIVDAEELSFKCVCNDCQGHIPIFQYDLKLSLDFHRQTEQHKIALKKMEMKENEENEKVEDKEVQSNAKNITFGDNVWGKNKENEVKRNDLNAETNKKAVFWNSLSEGDIKLAKSFDGLPVQRHQTKTFGQSKAPKKKRLYVQGHPNHQKSFDSDETVATTHSTPSSQHSVNIHLHIDTAAAAANTSQPNFPLHGTDVADATQEQYVQRRLVDTEVLDKLKNRTLEYREELELMWGCVKHAEGDCWNNEHVTKEGNVFHCHVCNEQLVSPYDVVLHVYGDDHLRDLGTFYCTIQ